MNEKYMTLIYVHIHHKKNTEELEMRQDLADKKSMRLEDEHS